MSRLKSFSVDYGFYSHVIRVKAANITEARQKALAKLRKTDPKKFINRHTTYVNREDW